jgi:hypothetical protein
VGKCATLRARCQPPRLERSRLRAEKFVDYQLPAEADGVDGTADDAQTAIFAQTQRGREVEHVVFVVTEKGDGLSRAKLGAQTTRRARIGNGHVGNRQASGG